MIERRKFFRSNLAPEYAVLYDGLCALLDDKWQPYAGYRTVAQQNALYAQGRTTHGALVTNAEGLESAHCWGMASDWTIFDSDGHPKWLTKEDTLWDEYTTAIWKMGLKAGKDFGDIDHNEYLIHCKWKDYKQGDNK